ncbi:PAS domain-containing sensor histidine kinase [Nocardioides jishulii]|nr:PAS domain-containing sensor histidine kinase [Nocardioides jishulii]
MPDAPETPTPRDPLRGVLLEALLRGTSLAIAVGDTQGRVRLMSPGLQELIQNRFSPVPVEDIPRYFRVYTEDGSRLLRSDEEPLNRARLGETFQDQVMAVELLDGSHVVLRARGAPLLGEDGAVQGGFVLFDDITAQRAQVERQNALRDRLVETVNHELRTPLTALLGHAEMLEDLVPQLPGWAATSLDRVLEAGERLSDLVRSVSALVDLEEVGHVHPAEHDLVPLLKRCVDDATAKRPCHGVVVTAPPTLMAMVDERLLARSLNALLVNALQHGPPGAPVHLTARQTNAGIEVTVEDRGAGISRAERERLVMPFERGVEGLTARPGRGLGLAVARSVAEAHGGGLELHDNEPNGLRAVLRLPSPVHRA